MARRSQDQTFGVRRRVVKLFAEVVTLGENPPFVNHQSTDGDLALRSGLGGQFETDPHHFEIEPAGGLVLLSKPHGRSASSASPIPKDKR